VQRLLDAGIKYATNYLISCIPSYTVRHAWYHYVLGWYIGPRAAILLGQHVHLTRARTNGVRVSIGSDAVIDHDCLLSTRGGLVLGEHVYISAGVWLITATREINDPRFAETYQPIVIDDYAWVGPRATILGGVTIGRAAIVQAGAVVTDDVEPNYVVAGVPATVVGMRELSNPAYSLNYRPLFE
jgi:maltose O-acetyltransferase